MDSKKFSIGDIVTLKAHPFLNNITNIILSDDQIMLSPVMVVIEIYKTKVKILSGTSSKDTYRYKCLWFSTRSYSFIETLGFEDDLKLIKSNTTEICISSLTRGNKITLKTGSIELAKKKSTITYEDNSINSGNGNTVISPILSFLPPVLQFMEIEMHVGKNSTKNNKTDEVIREIHSWDAKCLYFNPLSDKVSEITLPLEALELIEEVEESILQQLLDSIKKHAFLGIKTESGYSLVKPRKISHRIGNYYLRAFDYVLNKVIEIKITNKTEFSLLKSPFKIEAPQFNLELNPESANPSFIHSELISTILNAQKEKKYLRIKYKSRNDRITYRTLMEYKLIKINEDLGDGSYLIGFCKLRQAERCFKLDRIQNIQELELNY